MEANCRFGVEYFEHSLEAIFCGEVCLAVFRALARLPIAPIWNITATKFPQADLLELLFGVGLGLLGAAMAALFAAGHKANVAWFRAHGLYQ